MNYCKHYFFKSKTTSYSKVDTLVGILKTREDSKFETFCRVVNEDNSDLAELLRYHSGETMHNIM